MGDHEMSDAVILKNEDTVRRGAIAEKESLTAVGRTARFIGAIRGPDRTGRPSKLLRGLDESGWEWRNVW